MLHRFQLLIHSLRLHNSLRNVALYMRSCVFGAQRLLIPISTFHLASCSREPANILISMDAGNGLATSAASDDDLKRSWQHQGMTNGRDFGFDSCSKWTRWRPPISQFTPPLLFHPSTTLRGSRPILSQWLHSTVSSSIFIYCVDPIAAVAVWWIGRCLY